MTYSIIQAITNNYDAVYECNDNAASEKILITDITRNTKTWKQVVVQTEKQYPFDTIFRARWNPFEYSNSDYVIWIDGSYRINKSLVHLINEMQNADFAILKHPFRNTIYDEYRTWYMSRNYNKFDAFKWMSYMLENNFDPKSIGLYETSFCIFKNTERTREFCNIVNRILHLFDSEHFERLDQTVVSYLLNTTFRNLNIFVLTHSKIKNFVTRQANHPKH